MWETNDFILINYAIIGDVISFDDVVFELQHIEDEGESFLVRGIEMNWDEEVEFEIPDSTVVPLMIVL
jgi:hypothetical protein